MSYQQEIAGGYFWRTLWIQQNGVLAVVDRRMRHWVANAGYTTIREPQNREKTGSLLFIIKSYT